MPDSRLPSHQPDGSTEDRFLHWVDHLVDPTTGAAPPPDPDFAGVAETAHTIHRAAGLGASIAPSPERADAIWESLMHTSTGGLHVRSITPVQPAAFNGSAPPPAKLRPSAIAPRPGWRSYLMATALFAAIVVASAVALWRITDPLDGRDSDVANQPGFIASSTPATEVQCDLTSDMPVFVGSVPDAPFLDTYLLLDDGVLTMNCDQASTTIASGVEQVKPAAWPGAIALVMQDGTGQLVNLSNGATVTLGSGELLDHSGQVTTAPTEFVTAPHSPWLVSIANGNRTDWRITDLRTMESLLLSDEIGGSLPEPRLPLISNGLSSQSDIANGSGVAVIAFMNGEYEAADTPDADVHAGSLPTPGAALVLPGTLDARRWIDLSPAEARIPMLSAGVSADTSLLAYVTTADTGDELIRIERTTSGEDVAEMPIDQAECPTFSNQVLLFVGNEPKLLYSDGCSIEILSWSPDIERMPLDLDLLSGDVRVYPTADPDIVLLEQGGGAMTIDVTNGTVIREFQYVPYLGNQLQFSDGHGYVGAMVTVTADGPNDLAVIQIVNPVTGKVLAASQTIGAHPIQLTQTYGVSLVRNGTLAILLLPPDSAMEVPPLPPAAVIVLDAYTREEWMIKLPPYDDWLLIASPDGRYLSYVPLRTVLDGEEQSFMMKSTGPGSGWVEVPAGSVPGFVIGTHDLPSSITDEPAVLEAQEITPIVASPAATPATPVAISNGCDLTQDILVVTDRDTLPWDRTTVLLDGGTLSLQCDGTSTIVAEGVADVWSTYWPGAVIITMEDGTLHGVNLLTGATGDFGPANVLTESISPDTCYTCSQGSPWLAIPGNTQLTDWRIVDLKTMESLLLSDVIGGVLSTAMLARNNTTGDTPAVITFPGRPPTSGATPAPSETRDLPEASLPSSNAALVIDGSLDNHRWTEASSVPQVSASVSHGDSLLALAVTDDLGMTVRVERVDTGELVADTGIDLGAGDGFFVLDDGAGLLHLTDERLDLVTWNPELATGTLLEFETGQGLPQMFLTANPDVIIVSLINSLGESVGYLVNTSSGEIIEVPGLMRSALQAVYSEGMLPQFVLAASPAGSDGRQSTIRMIDVTTGDVAVESDPVEFDPAQVALRLSALRAQGTIGVSFYKPGHAVVLNALTGETFRIEAPTGIEDFAVDKEWYFYPSPDGEFIEAGTPNFQSSPEETRWFVRRLSPESEWVESPSGSLSALIVGSHALSQDGNQHP